MGQRGGTLRCVTAALALTAAATSLGAAANGGGETVAKWATLEIELVGPDSTSAGDPNPFDMLVDATFVGPSGQSFVVPGFYDGDGTGGADGDIWKVRFAADETGEWTYTTASAESLLDGLGGSFTVVEPLPTAPDFYRWGRLEAPGTAADGIRYFKFRDGPFWLKAGSDDPENFLGSFENYDTQQERFDSIDYLASKGVNSLYILTHNLEADESDVWPWLGELASEAKDNAMAGNVRFDIPRLHEWRDVFEHMQIQSVVTYMVLEDDSAWHDHDRDRYYRELVARFADLPALLFNICEEHDEVYSLSEAIEFAESLESIDPYDHPIAIHNENRGATDDGRVYLQTPALDFTSVQTGEIGLRGLNNRTREWIEEAELLGVRVPVINFDEARPLEDPTAWWPVFLGGGVWETHVAQPWDRPLDTWDDVWTRLGGARAFMESMPFWEGATCNELLLDGDSFCFGDPGRFYALYFDDDQSAELDLEPGRIYNYRWWSGANGQDGSFLLGGVVEADTVDLTPPNADGWAVLIEDVQQGALEVSIDGECPGPVTVTATGGTPGGVFAPARSNALGLTALPAAFCDGALLALDRPQQLPRRSFDAAGEVVFTANLSASQCGFRLQALDLDGCQVSNVAQVPSAVTARSAGD